jgi:hypothetical protein
MTRQRARVGDRRPPGRPIVHRSLLIRSPSERPLTKAQREFNRLVKQVETLRARFAAEERRLEAALLFHREHIGPRLDRLVALRKDLIAALAPFRRDRRVAAPDKRELRTMLIEQLDQVLQGTAEVDDDLRSLFADLHGISYDEAEREQVAEARSIITSMFADVGLDVDLSGFDANMSDEDLAARSAELQDELRRQASEFTARSAARSGGRPSKREQREADRQRALEDARKTSLGVVYRRLAKALHPDLERDPDARVRKGDLMREVTAAYAARDLHTLLRLELECLHDETRDIRELTDEKVMAHNHLLKEQVSELRQALAALAQHPKYELLWRDGPFGPCLEPAGDDDVAALEEMAAALEACTARVQAPDGVTNLLEIIRMRRAERRGRRPAASRRRF